ncbi:hypothetical protein [Galbibacter sp.]|uniref:hypothetical protein n=1 Tax=Galbibacter sp. TaxID=2918471 RepID=UPI003A918EA7
MKKFIFLTVIISTLLSCSSDESFDNNPYLARPSFKYQINLELPKYANIGNPGSAIYVNEPYVGISGVFVYNFGGGTFTAWEAACPNHIPNGDCLAMSLSSPIVTCGCDDYKYDLLTGSILTNPDTKDDKKYYTLQPYNVYYSSASNSITISN